MRCRHAVTDAGRRGARRAHSAAGSGHLGAARTRLRARRRAGVAARLPPRRYRGDVRQRARGGRGAACLGRRSATRCSSPPRSGRRISRPRELERAAKDSLVRLRLSEVDLLLLHWPNPQIPLSETLGALCKVKRMGLARHIGVSNFTVAMIEEAVRLSERAAGLQPDRDASVPRPVEGDRGLPRGRGWRSWPTARSPAAASRTTRCSRASARPTARPPRRSACASWCSRASSSSHAPAGSSGCRRIPRSSISR